MKSEKVTIRGKTYDLNEVSDLVSIQSALVPENWPTKKADGVRYFLSLQNMLALEFKRHLAANFKKIAKNAFEDGEEPGGVATAGVGFKFEVNFTVPQVVAIGKTGMSFSTTTKTEGKPKTHDLNQGEFLDDDLSVVLDTKGFAKEEETPPAPAEPEHSETPPAAGADGEPAPAGTDTAVDKKKRKKKK